MPNRKRKPTPSPPKWYWLDSDNCWWCKYSDDQKGCSNCKVLKAVVAKQKKKMAYKLLKKDY